MKKPIALVVLALLALLMAGCALGGQPAPFEGASVTGATLDEQAAGERMMFGVTVAQAGDPIGIDYRGSVSAGSLRAQLLDAADQTVWQEAASTGAFQFNTTLHPEPGQYLLGVAWDGPVQAQYNLTWKPHAIEAPTITPLALVPGVGMLAVALGFVAYALARRLGGRYLLGGALAWLLTVALKFAWAIPLNPPLARALEAALPPWLATPAFCVYVGALTGVFEVGITYLILWRRHEERAPWQSALAFGIGFGAVEAALLALSPLVSVLIALLSPNLLPPEAVAGLGPLNNVLYGLAPVWERFFVVWVHILANVLIFYALAMRRPRWFWLAFAYKTAIDTIAAAGQTLGLGGLGEIWTLEAAVAVFGIAGWLGTRWLSKRYPVPEANPCPVES
ncbi:MAG TPA: YhfC family glutamic-type intramembrane protease [Anaerolineae bacterium]|nr:YhfC family glutamic-type intramembrane protease [Anaerolineae bacterium]HPL26698.1 YhfC family glutamic-type intramembrane protease [Anaerolineae bacterium]